MESKIEIKMDSRSSLSTPGTTQKSLLHDMKKSILKVKTDSKSFIAKTPKTYPSGLNKSNLGKSNENIVKIESTNISTNTTSSKIGTESKTSVSINMKQSEESNKGSNKASSIKSSVSFLNTESKDDVSKETSSMNTSNSLSKPSTHVSSISMKVPIAMVKKVSITKKANSINPQNTTFNEALTRKEQTETNPSISKIFNKISQTSKNSRPYNFMARENAIVPNSLNGNFEENVAMIKLRKEDLVKFAQNIKEQEITNKDNLKKREETKNVIRRINTKEILELETPFIIDPPRLFCQDGYQYKKMKPIEETINAISSILDNHKNEIIEILKCCIEQGKQCSEILRVVLSALVEGDDCILAKLESNKVLQKEIMSELEKIINDIKKFQDIADLSNG